jgi:ParB-like chromosome segregation protein Spo0J
MANKKKKTIIGVQRSSFEKYEIEEIHREALKNAPYNPRTISAKAKKALKTNLEKVGLLAPIIWNRRTGNIV